MGFKFEGQWVNTIMGNFFRKSCAAATVLLGAASVVCAQAANREEGAPRTQGGVKLPSGGQLAAVPGTPRAVNSFPAAVALSPDGRYAVTMNEGYGTGESDYHQSLSVVDLQTDEIKDFREERLGRRSHQSYFLGLQFSPHGGKLYASFGSITDPTGEKEGDTGNGIAVYSFHDGNIAPESFIKMTLQKLAQGKIAAPVNRKLGAGYQVPYPAGLAFVGSAGERLLVANNLSDDACLVDVKTGAIVFRFDLSTQKVVPASYPYAVAVSRNGKLGYVSLWNASRVAELDLESGKVTRMIALGLPANATEAGSHPTALLLSPDESRLYVTLANLDQVAVVDVGTGIEIARINAGLPGQKYLGAYPISLAQSAEGDRLYVADAGVNAVAVIDVSKKFQPAIDGHPLPMLSPMGLIPTEWYPLALAIRGDDLLIASGKGRGAGPNKQITKPAAATELLKHPYIFEILHGSMARVNRKEAEKDLAALSQAVANNNAVRDKPEVLPFPGGKNPIHHVIYILKENRTYDQVLGDIQEGNGDASLVMFGEEITPNQHRLAREFGIIDNFYASGEVSGDGHNWSTAGMASDYLEKTIQISYRGKERTYDYEGNVAHRIPLEDEMPDVNETGTGYIWGNVARHHLAYRHYGEFVETQWCNQSASEDSPQEGTPEPEGAACPQTEIKQGERLPAHLGQPHGAASPWPWPVPIIAKNTATKPELRGHFDARFADFNLTFPDQLRADEFLNEFGEFVQAWKTGRGTELPNYILLRIPNDHTSGARAGQASPAAAVADNDLAVGRVVEAVSNSPYWEDTAIVITEDDAQNGPDHVDAHRTTAYVISKYSPGSADKPYRDSEFYTTVSMIRTIEVLLGLPPMNINDAHSNWMSPLFSGHGTHAPFQADYRNRDNGLIYTMNPAKGPDAKASAQMDFSDADRADATLLNEILWRNRKGNTPMPAIQHQVFPAAGDDK
jgi:DNA-binding beta-propeller fold protein YncE